ncbi:MAG TPA: TetR/AcrR family transcriptional regulator [Solirubrobacterales bacterium]
MKANGNGWKLPSGRHKLPREVVEAHQRSRLLAAAAEAVAEHGYAAVSVRHLIERAGVSRATFYQQFDDLQHCIVSACGDASERLIRDISSACASQREWPESVAAAVNAGLEFTVAAPAQAGLLMIGNSPVDRRLARRADAVRDQLAGLLRAGRERCPEALTEPDLMEPALIGGLISVIGAWLNAGQVDRLPQLRPELIQLLLTPYLGAPEARRVATVA